VLGADAFKLPQRMSHTLRGAVLAALDRRAAKRRLAMTGH
jgi:hypothetical protein